MKNTKLIAAALLSTALATACGSSPNVNQASGTNAVPKPGASPLTSSGAPQKIKDLMSERGEQDSASPILKIAVPAAGSVVASSTVKVQLDIAGDLKGYEPHMDPETKAGNHIHIILDNQPYEAYYNLDQEFELRNVADGEHVLRVFPSRPWHESYKNEGAFQMVKFVVKNGGSDPTKPATTNNGQQMSNANSTNTRAASTPEGKDMQSSSIEVLDPKLPLLTYSRPKGNYTGSDADAIMIDFWLINAKLTGDGGQYRVRYSVDGGPFEIIDKWGPVWLSGWTPGNHSVKLELIDANGNLVVNGSYNSTTRDINIVK
ncbi:MAG: hypothetical protein WBD22_08255 [Pyrinomonadaceae bacterium]